MINQKYYCVNYLEFVKSGRSAGCIVRTRLAGYNSFTSLLQNRAQIAGQLGFRGRHTWGGKYLCELKEYYFGGEVDTMKGCSGTLQLGKVWEYRSSKDKWCNAWSAKSKETKRTSCQFSCFVKFAFKKFCDSSKFPLPRLNKLRINEWPKVTFTYHISPSRATGIKLSWIFS